jgi:hypothetical protein
MSVIKKFTDYLATYTSTTVEQVLKCYVEQVAILTQQEDKG